MILVTENLPKELKIKQPEIEGYFDLLRDGTKPCFFDGQKAWFELAVPPRLIVMTHLIMRFECWIIVGRDRTGKDIAKCAELTLRYAIEDLFTQGQNFKPESPF